MIASGPKERSQTVVVVGNGMVGHRFCERLVEHDRQHGFRIVTFCEEPRAAYDRVGLTSFFAHRDAEKLMLAQQDWYRDKQIELHIGDRAKAIDRKRQIVSSEKGRTIRYDVLVLATGSYPFVPPIEGVQRPGVFVYRTIGDLERILAYGQRVKRCAVIGGGLLGLEAAKAAYDQGWETHVVEVAPRLMPRQIDEAASRILVKKIEALGVHVHLNKIAKQIAGSAHVEGLVFADGQRLDVDAVIVSAGICPRDDLARECKLEVGPRGGVVVDDSLQTTDPDIYAIGEVALHRGMIYGLVAPGYEMADVLAANLCGDARQYAGSDLSAKLKLLGVDVACFGDFAAGTDKARALVWEDPFGDVYKRLVFSHDGTRLLGGVLVGDARDYGLLLALARGGDSLPCPPGELIVGKPGGAGPLGSADALPDHAQVCSCNNVSKGALRAAIGERDLTTLAAVKQCTRAGTGCGGCVPLVTSILNAEVKAAGKTVTNHLCEHFAYSRQELFQIVKIKQIRSFGELLASHGKGHGCEVCKPAVASILASLWNEPVLGQATLQDTNDRFLANIQRGGLYSVVPRIPGGEITPDKLIVLGEVARKYGLYTKITGGQRIDLFGAPAHRLPDIWEDLVAAGFESGHAYGKAMRTVKSCVGTTWCRFAVGDSVGLAVRLELRYRGIRAPHKLKAAVSGCIRECAEAQSKDFGVIATEKGWNLYVCGNGGSQPRHADLLAADLDEETCIRYIDRFVMYYIQTADKLTRTARWLENMEGGIEYLRDVIVNDRLRIGDELERQVQYLVDTYRCEWKDVVEDPFKRQFFRQFVNTDETEPSIEFVEERGQQRPAGWPSDLVPVETLTASRKRRDEEFPAEPPRDWIAVGKQWDFPIDGGACVRAQGRQIAVFHFASRGEWYACQNMCPHKQEMVLARGILGEQGGVPKVACPMHKKTFSLETGACLSGDEYSVDVFPVKVDGDDVFVQVPVEVELADEDARSAGCGGAGCGCGGAGGLCETPLAELQPVAVA